MALGVFIIDDEGIMRDGLCALLSNEPEIAVLGTAASSAEALQHTASPAPEVVIMDFALTLRSGPDSVVAIKQRWPQTRVLVLTFHREDRYIDAALRAGADGYLLKNDSRGQLLAAIRSVASGQGFISPSMQDRVMSGNVRRRGSEHRPGRANPDLSEREREVMRMIAAGQRTREIAAALSLSEKTIEKHRTNLMRKLGLKSAPAVAAYAIANGYLEL